MNDDQKPPYGVLIFSGVAVIGLMTLMGDLVKALVVIGILIVLVFAFLIWQYGFGHVMKWVLSILPRPKD